MCHMDIQRFDISGPLLLTLQTFPDERGWFAEAYNARAFSEATGEHPVFVQQNLSVSVRGVLRGLHFQKPPHAQDKLIRVESGEVLDVAVDLRRGSPTFGRWISVRLSSETPQCFFIPKGFAHGFAVLSKTASFQYLVTDFWDKASEGGVVWNDPDLAIDWMIKTPIVAKKDAELPRFSELGDIFRYGE